MTTTSEDQTVQLGDLKITLQAPQSYALRWDVATAGATMPTRALAAALAACWPRKPRWPGESRKRPRPTYEGCGHQVGTYGGAVIDWLTSQGVTMPEIAYAGTVAYHLLADGLFGESEVQTAEDFSDPPEGA